MFLLVVEYLLLFVFSILIDFHYYIFHRISIQIVHEVIRTDIFFFVFFCLFFYSYDNNKALKAFQWKRFYAENSFEKIKLNFTLSSMVWFVFYCRLPYAYAMCLVRNKVVLSTTIIIINLSIIECLMPLRCL